MLDPSFSGRLIDYQKFAAYHAGRPAPEHRRFRTVMAPWDNTPRYGSSASIHINAEGDGYKNWLSEALLDTYRRFPPQERFVFLHSWNEWCEGTYLEPDARRGRRLLQETKDTVEIVRAAIGADRPDRTGADVWALFLRALQIKDEGAFRVLNSARLEARYTWQELERLRETRSQSESVSRTAAPSLLADPYERRLAARSIGLSIALTRIKRFFVIPFAKARQQPKEIRSGA